MVTQAFSASTAYGDIELSISRKTRDVVEKSAVIVTTSQIDLLLEQQWLKQTSPRILKTSALTYVRDA